MKKITIGSTALFLLLALPTHAQKSGVRFFEGTWAQALAEAKQQNKPIYLDCYTTWCGPCQMLKKGTFPDEKVGAYFNANYISFSLDMEKGEGIEIAKKYAVQGFPTHLYFNPNGEVVHRTMGGGESEEFKKIFLNWAEQALNPETQYYTLKKRYDAGERSTDFLYNYALAAEEASDPDVKSVARAYFATQKEDDLYNEKNWKAIKSLAKDYEFKEFNFLYRNKDEFIKRYGSFEVNSAILNVVLQTTANAKYQYDFGDKAFDKLAPVLEETATPEQRKQLYNTYLSFYRVTEQWQRYADFAVQYVESGPKDDWSELNEIAWSFFENVQDREMLAVAEGWAARSVELKSTFFNTDTYAAILHKLGKDEAALTYAQKAIEHAKADGMDASSTEELLTAIRSSLGKDMAKGE